MESFCKATSTSYVPEFDRLVFAVGDEIIAALGFQLHVSYSFIVPNKYLRRCLVDGQSDVVIECEGVIATGEEYAGVMRYGNAIDIASM
jgi:hypothetical protein